MAVGDSHCAVCLTNYVVHTGGCQGKGGLGGFIRQNMDNGLQQQIIT